MERGTVRVKFFFLKNTTHATSPAKLESGPLDLGASALTMMPPTLFSPLLFFANKLDVFFNHIQDTELQAWILDLHDNGYPVREGETNHGFPSSVASIEQLTHLLNIIIFTCACQHAAVNFSQMDTFGFPPNSPALMRQPPPTKKDSVTMNDVMKSLPSKHQAGVTIATVYDLTRIFPDEVNWT